MDFAFSEEQEMLRKMACDFLADKCPKAWVREMESDERGYSPDLWHQMAELGWMGLVFPEKYGGGGMSLLELAVLLEEMGRACLPGPFFSTVILAGLAILEGGTEEQKQEFLPRIANGEAILTLALNEPGAEQDANCINLKAVPEGDDYLLDGTKLFVSDAHIADYMVCVTRTKKGAGEDGITLFLLEAKSPGINYTLLRTLAGDKQCEVGFDRVRVPKWNMLGKPNHGWAIVEKVLQKAIVAKCAEMVGGAQQALEISVSYAKERKQFGRPIGSFQVIQHYCANMATDVDSSRFLTYQAAWRVSQGLPCTREVAIAKAWVSEAYRRVTAQGQQIHGGIGFTKEHDMPLYYKRAKAAELSFGGVDSQLEIVAGELLGCQ
ncbi:MAG TPA: acyl-CoA dehydrogenase family protein [Dehalococcoidia bacterium]|nr:acyl-CoA dehydrogenase family protein [Dehalococcoidia bacterium]